MAFGFTCINTSGQIIISDELQTMHFAGKITSNSNSSGYGTFPTHGGSLDGRVISTYSISTPGIPLVFIKPADNSRWSSIIKQSNSGNTWTFEVLTSGTSTSNMPTLYCFVDANDITIPASETYGMVVYKDDGTTKTFDSRVQPLAVVAGGTSQPRTLPANGGTPTTTTGHYWNDSTLDFNFRSNSNFTIDSITTTAPYTDLMFAAPSLAQAVYKRQKHGFKESCGCCGFVCQDHHSTAAWWVMYRNAFRISSGQFESGWGTYAAGYAFSSSFQSGGWFGGGSGSYSSGTQPYTPKTINLTSNAFIIADSTRYV